MENIIEINKNFDFNKIYLENPVPMQGGSFFTKINYSDKNLPLYVQLPKCKCKNGILKSTTSKKSYIDLLFNFTEEELVSWFENLENKCQNLIFSKKDNWFQSDMELEDIESMFLTPVRSYKSGKFISLRVNIPYTKTIKKEYCMIYDETEKILESDKVTDQKELIPLILIDGIRFTSKSFQLEINLPQLMVLNIDSCIKKTCMIKTSKVQIDSPNSNKSSLNIRNNLVHDKKDNNIKSLEDNIGENKNNNLQEKNIESKENIKLSNNDYLEEVDLELSNTSEEFSLKNPAEVYIEIYKKAKDKAKQLKLAAVTAFLEARDIKSKYNLEDSDISDEELFDSK